MMIWVHVRRSVGVESEIVQHDIDLASLKIAESFAARRHDYAVQSLHCGRA